MSNKENEEDKNQENGENEQQNEEMKKKKEEEDEEDAVELNPQAKKKTKPSVVSFYAEPLPLINPNMEEDDDKINNLVRRWKVEIYNIEITNISGNTISPFMQFIVGGDYRIEYK